MQVYWLRLISLVLLCLPSFAQAAPSVKDGVLDLRGVPLNEPIVAGGQWEFYWNQLLTPDTIEGAADHKKLIKVPGLWSQDPAQYSVKGYATYRLKVQLDEPRPIAIQFPASLWSSSRIFVDGQEIAQFGVVGTNGKDSQGGIGRKVHQLTPQRADFDLLIQVSNFEIFLCGMIKPPAIGTLDAIDSMRGRSLALDLFVMGTLFIMGIYHICLYALRTEDPSTVWFGILCLCVSVYMGASMESVLGLFFPDIAMVMQLRIFNVSWIGGVAAFVWFAHFVFQRNFSRWVCWISSAVALGYFLLIGATSHRLFVGIVNYYHAVTLLLLIYSLAVIIQSFRQKVEGSGVFLFGIMIMAFTTLHDLLAIRQIIVSPPLTGVGLMGFIFFQSTMIAMRFSKAFARVKTSEQEIRGLSEDLKRQHQKVVSLNNNLERLVDEKTRDIRTMMEHIPLGVFMITPDLKIHKDYSRRLLDIFPGQDLETMDAIDFLCARSTLSADDKNQAAACIQGTLGDDALNFETNAHLLPLELQQRAEGSQKFFDLTWNIIENAEGNVDKILVTIRDVTDLRRLQERNRDQQEELEFIGEILRVPSPRFLRFLRSCREFIQENERLIRSQSLESRNLEVLKLLFVNMHTVKGSARSLYLKKMSQVFHEVEQYYAHLQTHEAAEWDIERMTADMREARKIIDLYETIAREKLGRSSEQTNYVEFHIDQIGSIYRELQAASMKAGIAQDLHEVIEQVLALFHVKIFRDAREVLQELLGCLPVLAKDLHKELPDVQLETHGLMLSTQADELFRGIFVHLLRNTMDHGIETAAERTRAGKSPKGTIRVNMEKQEQTVRLTYSDDGRGLHLNKIRDMGLARGLLAAEEVHNRQRVAELIFDSGLSTANAVTDISGRGVGMDAVKRFIEQAGGSIRIHLNPAAKADAAFHAFSFEIDLPFELFERSHDEALPPLKAVP